MILNQPNQRFLITLTSEEKGFLEETPQPCENRKEGDHIKAILLRSEGWTVPQISQAGKLSNKSGGSESHLTEEQTQELIAHLGQNTYAHTHQIVLQVD